MNIGSLCTGYGGLDLACEQVFGARTIWRADNDPAVRKLLAYRWPDQPNLGDITKVNWYEVRPVDIVTAGWPCQPWSLAGKREGNRDARDLWPAVGVAIRLLRPRYVVLENVPAITAFGQLGRVVADLALLGYVGSWLCLRASDIGACHTRKRLFLVATHTVGKAGDQWRFAAGSTPQSWGAHREPGRRDRTPAGPAVEWGRYEPAVRRWESVLGRPAPQPTYLNKRVQRLSPAFVEWMLGLPDGWVSEVPGLVRGQKLKILGNGVVPQQATVAILRLLTRGVNRWTPSAYTSLPPDTMARAPFAVTTSTLAMT